MALTLPQHLTGDLSRPVATVLTAMLLVATLFMAAPSFAQAPATQPSTAPVSKPPSEPAMTEATTGSTTGTATTMPTPQPAEPNAPITMNFKDASLNTVLDYLSEAAGLVIVGDPRVEGRITIVSRRNVSVGEAVDLLDSALRENGYAAIRVGARNLKIVPIDDAKKEFIPVTKGVNPEEIEPNDRIITQIIPTRSADAVKLKNDLASLIPPSADIAANASSNMLIVTAPQSVVRRVVEIVHAIDVETSEISQVRVYPLKNANATNAAKLINDIFKDTTQNQSQQPGGGHHQFTLPGMTEAEGKDAKKVKVTASADDRTNTLVVSASPDVLLVIDGMVKKLDEDRVNSNTIFVYHLKNANAANAAKVINDLFKDPSQNQPQQSSGGGQRQFTLVGMPLPHPDDKGAKRVQVVASADERTNTLAVSASPEVLPVIDGMVKKMDEDRANPSTISVYHLNNASATNAARLINDIFKPPAQNQPQQQGGGGGQRQYTLPGMPRQPDGKDNKDVQVTASADDSTNTLAVSASSDVLPVIDGMVKKLDEDSANPNAMFIYHLKNGDATNLAGVMNNVFGLPGASSTTNYNSNNRTNSNTNMFGNNNNSGMNSFGTGGSNSFGLNNSSRTSNNNNRPGSSNMVGPSNGSNLGSRGPAGTGTASDLRGKVFVVADTATNSLVVTTAFKNFKRVTKIIDDLDRSVPQVLIKVLVCEVTHTNTVDLGVEFSGLNLTGANAVQGLSVGTQVTNTPVIEGKGESVGSNFNVVNNTSGGFMFALDEKYVTAAVHALSQLNKVNVLSRPYILTSDNQEATIMVGENDPFVTSSQVTTDGQVINNIQYQAIGIILDVTPHINGQGLVTLDVYPEISANTGRTVTLNQYASSPIFSQRYAQSRVAIRDGQTIVIGGMMQDQLTKEIDKVPFLGDIPVLGLLFQHTNEVKQKTELLIFLTPHVAKEPGELKGMTESEKSGTKIVQEAVDTGAYKNHLNGMDLGASTRPTTGPAAQDNTVYVPDDDVDDPLTTQPADKDSATTQPVEKKAPVSQPAAKDSNEKKP